MASNDTPQQDPEKSQEWQQDLINRLAFAAVDEQRRTRRWGIFFKFLFFAYLVVILFLYTPRVDLEPGAHARHTALVEMKGIIAADAVANAEDVITGLRAAFENENAAGVILHINSPGGSPVQSGYIHDEIQRLRAKYPETPLYAVLGDVCASGGYYVAVAADQVYADKASIVGSIGVRMDGFGFVGAMDKLGIERRLITAGENKGFLDPFRPVKEDDVEHVKTLLADIHQQFINVVKTGRGDRLKNDPKLFSGYIWTGEQAIELGLVDALGSPAQVARDVIGAETVVDYTPAESLLERISKGIGTSLGHGISERLSGTLLR